MKTKIITLEDVKKESRLNVNDIVSLENEIERLRLRQQYLNVIEDHLFNDSIQPYLNGNLLINDFELEKFALLLINKDKIQLLENEIGLMESFKKE